MFDTEDLPAPERVPAWHDFIAELMIPNTFRIDRALDFRGSLRVADLGAAQVVAPAHSSLRCGRSPALVRRSDPEVYMLGLTVRGRQGIAQARRQVTVDARRELVLYSSSQPYDVWSDAGEGVTAASVIAQVPRAMVPLPLRKVDRLLGSCFPARGGMGELLVQVLRHLVADPHAGGAGAGGFRPEDGPRLGMVLADLITGLLAQHVDEPRRVPPEAHQRTLFLRMRAFVHRHLADPELNVATIAAAHHLSTRQVQRLFQAQGLSVAAYIRQQRLERARHDLADPALVRRPIHAVAQRWGFAHPESFTRMFRAAYGVLPRDYRARAGRQDPPLV